MKETTTGAGALPKLKALIYGPSKAGKTYSALTLDPATTLIVSCEAGLLPLRGKNFDVLEVENWDDLNEIYRRLGTDEYKAKYKTIFLDSLTEMNEMCKAKIVGGDRAIDSGNAKEKVNKDLMLQSDYQLLETRMIRLLRLFRDLPYNVIMAALVNYQEDKQTGAIRAVPSLNGKLATNAAAYFDEVFYLVARPSGDGKMERFFVTNPIERSIAGDRSGKLDAYEPPHWGIIFRKALGIEKKDEKAKPKVKEEK